jgi:hypothetical protein
MAESKTPEEWAKVVFPERGGRPHPDLWKHSAAVALHGWNEHVYHAGVAIVLSQASYEAALLAACTIPDGAHDYAPHQAALSPHSPLARGSTEPK